ncbi:MAG: YheV family putative metal-binding protein [Halioglobus sp.]|nr:YheV family putative metal-binding protein [Halioglobus sp.]
MQQSGNRRRFIAGAVCPRCGQMDRIVVDLDTDRRECVACSFSEPRPSADSVRAAGGTGELPTRVSRGVARRVETPAQPVTLIDETKPRG